MLNNNSKVRRMSLLDRLNSSAFLINVYSNSKPKKRGKIYNKNEARFNEETLDETYLQRQKNAYLDPATPSNFNKSSNLEEEIMPIISEDANDDMSIVPMSQLGIIVLNISFFGVNLMFLTLSVVVIPAQVAHMVGGENKGSVLGAIVAGGAVLTFISGPLIGIKSDRLATRFGRRRPIMVVAALCLSIGLLGMAISAPNVNFNKVIQSENNTQNGVCITDLVAKRCQFYYSKNRSVTYTFDVQHRKIVLAQQDYGDTYSVLGLFVTFYLVVIVSYVCVITPYNAFISDKTHPLQRGTISGVMGGMILLGNISGAGLGFIFTKIGVLNTYGIIIAVLLVCLFVTVVFTPEKASNYSNININCSDVLFAFWSPLKEPDFRWVFITRFLMQQGLSTTVGFLEYWLSDMIHLPYCWNSARGVSVLLLPLLFFAAAAAPLCGYLSDRIGQRKPLIIIASVVMAIVAAALAFLRGHYSFYVAIVCAIFFGMAFGAYQAVDFALLMDVLPNKRDTSRDIAVWQQALVLPQALAVPIGGVILDLFERANCQIGLGYIMLFIITSAYFFLGGIFVRKIKCAK